MLARMEATQFFATLSGFSYLWALVMIVLDVRSKSCIKQESLQTLPVLPIAAWLTVGAAGFSFFASVVLDWGVVQTTLVNAGIIVASGGVVFGYRLLTLQRHRQWQRKQVQAALEGRPSTAGTLLTVTGPPLTWHASMSVLALLFGCSLIVLGFTA